jgi:hypothetical protein
VIRDIVTSWRVSASARPSEEGGGPSSNMCDSSHCEEVHPRMGRGARASTGFISEAVYRPPLRMRSRPGRVPRGFPIPSARCGERDDPSDVASAMHVARASARDYPAAFRKAWQRAAGIPGMRHPPPGPSGAVLRPGAVYAAMLMRHNARGLVVRGLAIPSTQKIRPLRHLVPRRGVSHAVRALLP